MSEWLMGVEIWLGPWKWPATLAFCAFVAIVPPWLLNWWVFNRWWK